MSQRTCTICASPYEGRGPSAKYCSTRCKWTAANQKRYKRPDRSCPGCGTSLSDLHGRQKYCSEGCRRWIANGHTGFRSFAAACSTCKGSMEGKRSNAVYCSRTCKLRASEERRDRDDAARYQVERDRRIAYATSYAKANPHVGRAARARRKAWKRKAGIFAISGKDWRRLCSRHREACFYCDAHEPLTMDHVIPLSKGGRHSIGNIIPACLSCNSSKSDSFLAAWRLKRQRG